MELYWGDLHNHCGISYGFGSWDHWDEVRKTVAAANGPGLVTFQSYEMHSGPAAAPM